MLEDSIAEVSSAAVIELMELKHNCMLRIFTLQLYYSSPRPFYVEVNIAIIELPPSLI